MNGKKISWQEIVGMVLLIALCIPLVLPVMKISGDAYISAAVKVNKHAKEQDEKKAKDAGASDMLKSYEKDTKEREKKEKEYDKEIEKKKDSILGFELVKWCLTVKEHDDFKWKGMALQKEKEKDSGVAGVFKFMAVLLLLPAVLGIIGCIACFIKRKGYGIWLLVSGIASVGAYLVIQYVFPGMIWDKAADYIEEFSLINKKVLDMEDMGEYTISTMMHEFSSTGMLTGLVLGCVLAVAGVLFITVFKPAKQQEDDDWDFDLPPVGGGVPPMNGNYQADASQGMFQEPYGMEGGYNYQNGGWDNNEAASGMEQMVTEAWQQEGMQTPQAAQMGNPPKGMLLGVAGQYRGAVVEIDAGEEVILGRDPKYCKLVFEYAKVSRKHCGIIFDASSGMYRVIDYSSNGTLLSNGCEAMAGSYITVEPGTVVYLADRHEGVELCNPVQDNGAWR